MPIDDLPAPSSISDLPAPTKEPSTLQKGAAFAYGLGTSIPGTLGDIESMLPGGAEVGAKGKGTLAGYESVFPTTKNIQAGLTKLGVPQPVPGTEGYQLAGEVAPAVAATGKALYSGGKALYGAGKTFAEKLKLGKTAKELAENLRLLGESKAGQISKKTGEEMTAAEQRAAIAGKAGEKAERGAELSMRPLPGVTTAEEAGRFKPIAQTTQEIGEKIKQSANQIMERLKAKRNANAEINKQAAFGTAFQKEAAGQSIKETKAYNRALQEIDAMRKNPVTGYGTAVVPELDAQLKKIRDMLDPVIVSDEGVVIAKSPASFEGLEQARRWMRDRSYGVPAEGYDAISQQMAGQLADRIEDIMKEFSPGIDKFLKQYAKDSEGLRVFSTKMGKALVNEQLTGKGANYATVAAQDIPGQAFRNKESFDALVDAFGGNRQLAQAEAKRYFASQLESKGTAKEVENYIRQNRAMLKETGVMPMAEKYAIDLRTFEKRAGAAQQIAKTEEKTAQQKKQLVQDYKTFESDLAVAGNDPARITAVSNQLAKRMLEHGQINQAQYRDLQRQIERVRLTVRDANEMKDKIKLFVYRALGYGAAATVGSAVATKAFEQ
jgi:hypothetical protein